MRRYRWLALLCISYVLARWAFVHWTTEEGLLTPSGSPQTAVWLSGFLVLVLRAAVLTVVPVFVTYRAVLFGLAKARVPRRGP